MGNINGNIYFGHSRLAILEPTEAGFQPMVSASKRFTITFNGEIYNHLELRRFLPDVKWRGTSDTETLIELFNQRERDAFTDVKGYVRLCNS